VAYLGPVVKEPED